VAQLLFNAYWFAFNRDANFLTEHQVELTESTFIEFTQYSRIELRWPGVLRVCTGFGRLFILDGPAKAHCIPSRAFEDAAAFQAFASRAKERWLAARRDA
jgi:hypothetical protein